MANEDLGMRFSNQTYATKQEVSRALNLSMIDDIWNKILAYRSSFHRTLSLRNIEKVPYHITLAPVISDRLTNVERKLTKVMLRFDKISDSQIKAQIKEERMIRILYWVAKKYRLDVEESSLYAMIHHQVSSVAPNEMILINYFSALEYIESHYVDPLDIPFAKYLYATLVGVDVEEVSFRKNELNDNTSKYTIGRTYHAAPMERIEPMMDNLLDFIIHDPINPLIKAIATYYFISHIKPFDVYSEEIAMLYAKSILAHHDLEDIASMLEFEQILSDNLETISSRMQEVQKTNDMTYFFLYFLDICEDVVNEILDALVHVNVTSIRQEYYQEEEKQERKAVAIPDIEINRPLSIEASGQVDFELNVAIPKVPIGLEEKDAMKIEEHLVEIYPTLKRGQAHFYARHCTIGKYYTIAQYKRLLNCAYETARTSMDNLVELGFYRKEKLNNKFIYTPIARK